MSLINTVGRLRVVAKSAQFGESKNGTPFIEIGFADDKGDTISAWVYLSDAAFPYAVKTLREAFGFDNNFETLPAQIIGKEAEITTEMENFEGKDRLKVLYINNVNGARVVTPIKDASLLGKLSQKAARLPVEAPKAASSAPKATPTAAPAADTTKKPDPF